MEFDNSFEVPLPMGDAWKLLMDIRRIAPCMPGAEVTDVVDERTYKGSIGVRLGPVALTFAGTVKFEEIDDNMTRISLRSKSAKVNVNEIAAQFGGGGHPAAAGARIAGKPISVQRRVIVAIKKALNNAR